MKIQQEGGFFVVAVVVHFEDDEARMAIIIDGFSN